MLGDMKDDLQQYEGEYVKSIDLNRYNKGNMEIMTNREINKKLILQ